MEFFEKNHTKKMIRTYPHIIQIQASTIYSKRMKDIYADLNKPVEKRHDKQTRQVKEKIKKVSKTIKNHFFNLLGPSNHFPCLNTASSIYLTSFSEAFTPNMNETNINHQLIYN